MLIIRGSDNEGTTVGLNQREFASKCGGLGQAKSGDPGEDHCKKPTHHVLTHSCGLPLHESFCAEVTVFEQDCKDHN